MLRWLCCVSQRPSGPRSSSKKYKDHSKDKSQTLMQRSFPLDSTGTLETSKSEGALEMRRIFAASSPYDPTETLDVLPNHRGRQSESTGERVSHGKSPGRLHEALRKRLSRDSDFRWKRSDKNSRTKLTEEEIWRRKEIKRAIHERLHEELLTDQGRSNGGYDTDAEIIATPTLSKSRSGGAIQMTPEELSDLVRHLEKSGSKISFLDERDHAPSDTGGEGAYKAHGLRYETVSGTTSVWEDDVPEPTNNLQATLDEIRDSLRPGQNRWSRIMDPNSSTGNASPNAELQRSSTVIRIPISAERRLSGSKVDVAGTPLSPDLLPLRLPSIPDSVRRDWHLQTSGQHSDSEFASTHSLKERLPVPHLNNSTRPKVWSHESSGLLRSSVFAREPEDNYIHSPTAAGITHTPACDPALEEHGFGGVDGESGDHDGPVRIRQGSMHRDVVAVSSLEDVGPQEAASPSKSLLPTVSMPLLNAELRHGRQRSSWGSRTGVPLMNGRSRRSGSSDYLRPSYLSAHRPYRDNASSVYTSHPTSRASSQVGIGNRPGDLAEMVEFLRTSDLRVPPTHKWRSSSDIVSLAGSPLELLQSDLSQICTVETASWKSSTDSFRAQEIAAAEKRIVPKTRAFSTPKVSRFREEISRASEASCTKRKKAQKADNLRLRLDSGSHEGSGDWYSASETQGYRCRFVREESESASDMWERALQDHARELAVVSDHGTYRSHGSRGRGTRPSILEKRSRSILSLDRTPKGLKNKASGTLSIVAASVRLPQGVHPSPAKSSPSWGRYPSHTREERSLESAGGPDYVQTYDFAPELGVMKTPYLQGTKKKSRSMTFGKRILKPWSRLYKSQSSNLARHYRGYRTSVSLAGELQHPELEILPPGSPSLQLPIKQDRISFNLPRYNGDSSFESDENLAQFHERSANAWSKLYEDCVQIPQSESIRELSWPDSSPPGTLQHPGAGQSIAESFHEPSSMSIAEIRASTLDFEKALRQYEAQALEMALQAARSV